LEGGREPEAVCSKTEEVFHSDATVMTFPQQEVYNLCTTENIITEI
jgi:hypothetical protein